MTRFLKGLKDDRGAALITVMLLVSVMSASAVVAFERLDFSIRRTARIDTLMQAREYAVGGEAIASNYAVKIAASKLLSRQFARQGGTETISFPVEGGSIEGTLTDRSNCFNVNSLAADIDPESNLTPATERYEALLVALGMPTIQAKHLTATLKDWLDADTRPSRYGAEDYDYSVLKSPYRAANTYLADVGELAFIKGYTKDIRDSLKPYVCALNHSDAAILHVNSLKPQDAPLLVSLLSGQISMEDAVLLIGARPAGGYTSVAGFWKERTFQDISISQDIRKLTEVTPQLFGADIRVTYHGVQSDMTSLILVSNNVSTTLSRFYGRRT